VETIGCINESQTAEISDKIIAANYLFLSHCLTFKRKKRKMKFPKVFPISIFGHLFLSIFEKGIYFWEKRNTETINFFSVSV
jgi:hypothetical protein